MRYLRRGLLAVMACLLSTGIVACANQTADANKAIDAANVQIQKYTEAGNALEKLMGEAEALPMDQASAKKALSLTDEMTARLDEQRTAAEAARAELAKIKTMRVPAEFKTYADKEVTVTDTLLKEDPVAREIIKELRTVYELVASGKGTQAEIDEAGKHIDEGTKQLTALEDQAGKQERDASTYFESKKLGG